MFMFISAGMFVFISAYMCVLQCQYGCVFIGAGISCVHECWYVCVFISAGMLCVFFSASMFVCSSVPVCLCVHQCQYACVFISASMFVCSSVPVCLCVHQCQYVCVFISVSMFVCSSVPVCLCVHQCRYVCRLDRNRVWTVSPGPQHQPSQPGVTAGVERIYTICSVCPGSVRLFLSAPASMLHSTPFHLCPELLLRPPSLCFSLSLSVSLSFSLLHPKQLKNKHHCIYHVGISRTS